MIILFSRDIPHRPTKTEAAAIAAAYPGVELRFATGSPKDGPLEVGDAEVLVTDLDLPASAASCPRLRWIQLVSAGGNQISKTSFADSAVSVTTASGLHGVPIGQFVIGCLLMMVHQFPRLAEIQRAAVWPPQRWHLRGYILRGQTAGILGYGSIGRECARQLHALGMRIVALDPADKIDKGYNHWPETGDPDGRLPAMWFKPPQLHAMLAECDVLVVAAPYTAHTAGIIGAREMRLLRPGAKIIVISRGGIVQETPLAEALSAGVISGAAVDCFEQEPLPPEHVFNRTPNLILTPHMAGAFEGFWDAMMGLFVKNLVRYRAGEPLLNEANKRLGY